VSRVALVAVLALAAGACSRGVVPTGAVADAAPLPVYSAPTGAPEPRATATPSALAPTPEVGAPPAPIAGVYLGRRLATPMSHLGAAWLDRAGRDAVQQPEHVLDVVGVRVGARVCDFGAGSGYFTVHLARRVGPTGHVFAVDLQPEMLALLGKKLTREGLSNVTPVLAKASEPSLAKGSVDLVLMVDVYHELERPDLTMAQLREALTPGGRVAWVEYRAEDPNVTIKPDHKLSLAQIRREAAAAGYTVARVDESLPQQRIVVLTP
jgi:predicted methyltransferase